ncbi:hypothetical protein HDU79_001653 [Rhizoclosmatium sp. JEL0117]|nr:hypothetical protein HDU79_001653 [Rhizoclosmatium sp. JEL0117]
MRSLIQTTCTTYQQGTALNTVHLSVDSDTSSLLLAGVSEGGDVSQFRLTRTTADETPVFPEATAATGLAAFHFLADRQKSVFAFKSGEIGTLDSEGRYDVVGNVDAGLAAMLWAPDAELGVFVALNGAVLLMTPDFDVVGEVDLFSETHAEEQFVSVGWGKKETQFHGSLGKQAAQEKVEDVRNSLTADDDRLPRISWRQDGKYFCVSCVDPVKLRRILHTYTRECTLHSVSEPIPLLHKVVSWRPAGNLIATVQTLPSKQLQIAFFETNGLRHGEFALRETESSASVVSLAWNSDSSILAVHLVRAATNQHVIQLWTMGNYYYYLKQELLSSAPIDSLLWDPEDSLRLHVSTDKGRTVQSYSFTTVIQTSSSTSTSTFQPVLVTDGTHLLVTPFRTSNMPPPMYESKIGPFSAAVSSAAVGEGDIVVALLSTGALVLATEINSKTPVLKSIAHTVQIGVTYRQVAVLGSNTVLVIASSEDPTESDYIVVFEVKETGDKAEVVMTGKISVPGADQLMRLNADLRSGVVLVEAVDGAVFQLESLDGASWTAEFLTQLPAPCPWIGSVEIGSDAESLQTVVIGLSDRNRLYVNARLISSEVTSFFIHDDHIIVTTLSHTARFIPLSGVEVEDDLNIPAVGTSVHDETLRRVERGSRIVTAVPGDMKLILQMPRGNLETIYPRALVLSSIRSSLDKLNFSNAFILCRKHRINMNLLVDHNPELFMKNVDLFVSQVKDPDYLNLFVSSLSETDVTTTMYIPSPPPSKTRAAYFKPSEKVNTLCATVRNSLAPLDTVTYVTTVLTTFAKQTPQDLESAMAKVKSMKQVSLHETETALKYLIFLANANLLYNVALGMYDFQLVVMVAQFSQKDPREYLPFLTALKLLPKHRQYFKIDDHLARHASALSHLAAMISDLDASPETVADANQVFSEELIPYMAQHDLFKHALVKYETHPQRLQQILRSYGATLFGKAKFAESGLMYQMAGDLTKSLVSYRGDVSLWRQCMSVAQAIGDEKQVLEVANEIAEGLFERHEYRDAATVYLEYSGEVVLGVRALLKACLWDEAVRVAYKYKRGDLVSTEVKDGVFAEYESTMDDLKEMLVTFQKQRARLDIVRREHLEYQAKIESGEYDPLLDNVDMMSDTTSMASSRRTGFSSRSGKSAISTGTSSKARRRQDRKRAAGREGGFYEEEFLVNSLHKAVEKSNSMRPAIYRLITALMSHSLINESRTLQSTYTDMVPLLKAGCEGVFEKENIVIKGMGGKTVEEEKIEFMVKIGSLPASMLPGASNASSANRGHNGANKVVLANTQITNEAEVERKRDPKYPDAPVFSTDSYGLDVL